MKTQDLTIYPNASLCINEKHTFLWKLMTKGKRLYKDMKALGEIEVWIWTMDKDEATLKNVRGSKFLNKRSTQIGGASS
jgi:uncharacterized pyridoxamine 5'-phosphate oxidase family protein